MHQIFTQSFTSLAVISAISVLPIFFNKIRGSLTLPLLGSLLNEIKRCRLQSLNDFFDWIGLTLRNYFYCSNTVHLDADNSVTIFSDQFNSADSSRDDNIETGPSVFVSTIATHWIPTSSFLTWFVLMWIQRTLRLGYEACLRYRPRIFQDERVVSM